MKGFIIALFFPAILCAQRPTVEKIVGKYIKGIEWTKGLTWNEVKRKAKAENKYILVDCYATWCAYCKKMDQEVYGDDSVGVIINKMFIPIKIQFDTTPYDNQEVKNWYVDAQKFKNKYAVNAYPTFLFFSPDGQLVQKETGFLDSEFFIKICLDALDPDRQIYQLLEKFERGERNYATMRYLALAALRMKKRDIAQKIASDYVDNFLLTLKSDSLFNAENIAFLCQFSSGSNSKNFHFVYNNARRINSVMRNADFAQYFIYSTIYKEEITPVLNLLSNKANHLIDWDSIEIGIAKKYNSYYANRVVTDAKSKWFRYKGEWSKSCKFTVEYIEKYGQFMGDFDLASSSWAVFKHSTDSLQLNKALLWAAKVIARSKDSSNILPNVIDTYANLLYKINYLYNDQDFYKEALELEEKALAIMVKHNKNNKSKIQMFKDTLEKMRRGEPTWQVE